MVNWIWQKLRTVRMKQSQKLLTTNVLLILKIVFNIIVRCSMIAMFYLQSIKKIIKTYWDKFLRC